MGITYVGGTTGTGASAAYAVGLTGLTGGTDSAPVAGDLVIAAIAASGTADLALTVTSPAGYTDAGSRYSNGTTSDANMHILYRIMPASPDTSITVSGSGNAANGAATVVRVYRGVNQATPMDVTAVASGGTGSATPNPPSITPVTVGALVMITGVYAAASVDATFTVPANYTLGRDASTDPGMACHCFTAHRTTMWTSGAEDAAGWGTITGAAGDSWGAISVVIRPNNFAFFPFLIGT
jgi:hypothetical protein